MPAEVTSFVGRRHEVADVKHLLSRSRLVTLTGTGGVGKTRLAYRAATDLRRAFPDGVWLAELAELENPELLTHTLAEVLGITDSTRPTVNSLIDHLRDMRTLIVLDNCEHLSPACGALADMLLSAAPGLRILATSRQVLGIAGEQALTVPVLPLPGTGPLSVESFAQCDAVRLFADRAQAVLPGFTVTPDNREAIDRICRRLDGIPLAIELAAVRLRALSVPQLLDRLDDRFRLLESGSRAALPRHRTLWALVDWSHALCTPEERLLWERASVFAGGMDLEAAEAVCAGDGIERADVLDLVTGLVDKSVLLREESPLGVRYRLLDSLREYGRGRLAESGGEPAVRRRYRDFYRNLCRESHEQLFGPSQAALITRLKLENANLRSVLDQLLSSPGPDGLHMVADLRNQWLAGYLSEGRQRLRQGMAVHRDPDEARGRALVLEGLLAVIAGDPDSAGTVLDEAQDIGERLQDGLVLADVALNRGLIAIEHGDAEAAIALCREAVARHDANGDLTGRARSRMWLTAALTLGDDVPAAVSAAEDGIAICEAHGEDFYRTFLLLVLSIALWRGHDTARASELAKESLAFHRSIGSPLGITFALALLTWVATTDGRYERAARLVAILDSFSERPVSREAIGALVGGYRHLGRYHDQCVTEIRRALSEETYAAEIRRGGRLSLDRALAYAMEDEDAPGARHPEGPRASALTRRETEVARLVAQGLSNKEIAAELRIATRTVEGHVEHILSKLGFGSRTKIAVWISGHDLERAAGGDRA